MNSTIVKTNFYLMLYFDEDKYVKRKSRICISSQIKDVKLQRLIMIKIKCFSNDRIYIKV